MINGSPALVLLSFLLVDLPPQDRGIMVHGIYFFFFRLSFLNDRKSGSERVKSRETSFFFGLVFRQNYGDININSLYCFFIK